MDWLDTLVSYAQAQLGDREREVLWMRGVSDDQISCFRLGYLNGVIPSYVGESFIKKYDGTHWLRDVFVLPLTNALGQIGGIQLRHALLETRGYSDFILFEDEPVLFGLTQAVSCAWVTGSLWVVEGAFDMFPIQRVYPNVIATLTNRISSQVALLLSRVVDTIWLAYDMDIEGRKAAARVCRQYGTLFKIHDVRFPRVPHSKGALVKDPGELWEAWGDEPFQAYLKRLVGGNDMEVVYG